MVAAAGGGGSVVVAGGVAVSVGVGLGDGVGDSVGEEVGEVVVEVGFVDGVVGLVDGCVDVADGVAAGGLCVPPDGDVRVVVGAACPAPGSPPDRWVEDSPCVAVGCSGETGISVPVAVTGPALLRGSAEVAIDPRSVTDFTAVVEWAVDVAVPTTSVGAGGSACGEGDPMTNAATTIPTALIPVTVAASAVSERRSFSQPIEVCRASMTTAPLPAIVRSVDPAAGTGPRSRTSFARRLPCTDSGGPNRSFVGPRPSGLSGSGAGEVCRSDKEAPHRRISTVMQMVPLVRLIRLGKPILPGRLLQPPDHPVEQRKEGPDSGIRHVRPHLDRYFRPATASANRARPEVRPLLRRRSRASAAR